MTALSDFCARVAARVLPAHGKAGGAGDAATGSADDPGRAAPAPTDAATSAPPEPEPRCLPFD
jgi:hypothetical protein